MAIGDNIKKLREIHDLSQKDLALIAGVTDKAVSTWENGVKEPRMGTIQKIADHFGLQKSNIIEENGLEQICKTHDKNKITSLTEEDIDLIEKIKSLPLEKRKAIKKITETPQSQQTIAAHRTDDPTTELPEEARKSIDDFKKFIYEKHGIKYD